MNGNTPETLMYILKQLSIYTYPVLAVIVVLIYGNRLRKWLLPHHTVGASTPLLLSYGITGGTDLVAAPGGTTPHGMHFDFYISNMSLFSTQQTYGIYTVELPFTSGVHLVGSPTHGDTQINLSDTKGMEPVTLEGTYNQVFNLYAEPNQQVQSRYVLDPTAMVFTLDFCSKFNWEILNDTLFFMDAEHFPTFEIVDEFVEQIRPAIEVPSDRTKNPYNMSYTQLDGRTFLYPICQQKLVTGTAWLACPGGHGCLVTGKQLMEMREQTEPVPADETNATLHNALTCPYCQNPMVPTRYQQTSVTIDVCSKCMFRWLDAREPTTLFKHSQV